jgi:hypothetical protein
MPELTQDEQTLLQRAKTITDWPLVGLLHPESGGSFNFASERPLFDLICQLYADLASVSLSAPHPNIVRQAIQSAESIIRLFAAIRNFDPKSGDPNQTSQNLANELRSTYYEAYNGLCPHLALARIRSTAIKGEFDSLHSAIAALDVERNRVAQEHAAKTAAADRVLQQQIDRLEEVTAAAREASRVEGVSAQANEFDKEAGSSRRASNWWFLASLATIVSSLFLVWHLFLAANSPSPSRPLANSPVAPRPQSQSITPQPTLPPQPTETPLEKSLTIGLLQQTAARILIVALLYAAVVWCARNYFACRHNYTVNRHRRNAMQTFRAFVQGTKDPATQDFILRQAAACAFAPQQSGYLKDESLPMPGPASQFIDIARQEPK